MIAIVTREYIAIASKNVDICIEAWSGLKDFESKDTNNRQKFAKKFISNLFNERLYWQFNRRDYKSRTASIETELDSLDFTTMTASQENAFKLSVEVKKYITEYSKRHPQYLLLMLQEYAQTLKEYQEQADDLIAFNTQKNANTISIISDSIDSNNKKQQITTQLNVVQQQIDQLTESISQCTMIYLQYRYDTPDYEPYFQNVTSALTSLYSVNNNVLPAVITLLREEPIFIKSLGNDYIPVTGSIDQNRDPGLAYLRDAQMDKSNLTKQTNSINAITNSIGNSPFRVSKNKLQSFVQLRSLDESLKLSEILLFQNLVVVSTNQVLFVLLTQYSNSIVDMQDLFDYMPDEAIQSIDDNIEYSANRMKNFKSETIFKEPMILSQTAPKDFILNRPVNLLIPKTLNLTGDDDDDEKMQDAQQYSSDSESSGSLTPEVPIGKCYYCVDFLIEYTAKCVIHISVLLCVSLDVLKYRHGSSVR